jgi:hypothetical protein
MLRPYPRGSLRRTPQITWIQRQSLKPLQGKPRRGKLSTVVPYPELRLWNDFSRVPNDFSRVPNDFWAVQTDFPLVPNNFSVVRNDFGVVQNGFSVDPKDYGMVRNNFSMVQNDFSVVRNDFLPVPNHFSMGRNKFGRMQDGFSAVRNDFFSGWPTKSVTFVGCILGPTTGEKPRRLCFWAVMHRLLYRVSGLTRRVRSGHSQEGCTIARLT